MKMYKHLFAKNGAPFIYRKLWKSNCRLRHKIFFWMLLYDRVSTRNMLHRKNMYLPDYNCALCLDRTQETLIHLFWDCHFAFNCWNCILPNIQRGISTYDEIGMMITLLPQDLAMEIIIMGCWAIWMVRNDKIFNSIPTSIDRWKFIFLTELHLLKFRIKEKFSDSFCSWLDTLLL